MVYLLNIAMNLGNDGAGFHDLVPYVGNVFMCAHRRRIQQFSRCHWMRMLDTRLVFRRDRLPGVRLGRVRFLSIGGRNRDGTRHLLLTTRILRVCQPVSMDVGKSGADVRNVILDIGSNGTGVHDIVTSGGCVRVCCKFPL